MKNEVVLGNIVKDTVSGMIGTVTCISEALNGNVQMGIQPEGDGKSHPEGNFIDHHLVEFVKAGISELLPPVDTTVTIKLGEKVRDIVSKFEGIAVEKITFQNGCVYFLVQPEGKKKEEIPEAVQFSHLRLVRTGAGIAAKVAEFRKQKPVQKKPPGGPSRPMNSIRMA